MKTVRLVGLFLACVILAVHSLQGAITVNGLTDRSRYNASVTFTVVSEAGFNTAAALDGGPVPVGSPVVVDSVRYHELVVTREPSGGGTAETRTIQFIVRNPERITTEDGIPTFTPPPAVDDAPSAFAGSTLVVVAPSAMPTGLSVPVVTLLRRADGSPLWLNGTVHSTNYPAANLRFLRGYGSVLLPGSTTPGATSIDARVADLTASRTVTIETNNWTARSGTLGGSENWGTDARVSITGSVTVPAGTELRIGAGSVVALAPDVELIVNGGRVTIDGTLANPVVFVPLTNGQPWGGIRLTTTAGSRFTGTGLILTGGGADPTWFNTHAGYTVHRRDQACLLVDSGAQALLTNCFFIHLAGQALHLKNGTLHLRDCLVNRATTVGQFNGGTFSAGRCGFLEFPDTSRNFVDEDNDALYLIPGGGNTYTVEDCVMGFTKDDGIDTGAGRILVRHCWIENCFHEGVSPSTTVHTMELSDTVFAHCGQGIEQGFGTTTVVANRCVAVDCMVGLRCGDNYGAPTFTDYSGLFTASNCISIFNLFQDVWGYEWSSWTYRTDRMNMLNNQFTSPNNRHPNNRAWDPAADGPALASLMPVPNSPVGLAITEARSASLFEYPGSYDVRLSTFSSQPVRINYRLIGKSAPAAPTETVLAGGSLEFAPGQTHQVLNLDLPAVRTFDYVRLALSEPQNAEVIGPDLLYFATDPAPADQILIPGGASGWSYQALRVEPAGAWEAYDYVENNWVQNCTAPIGFGAIGNLASLGTVLTSAEQGPSTDRTRAVYFRRHFQIADPSLVSELRLRLMRDDGVVVYLNGQQVGRNNIDSGTTTGGTISYSRLATTAIDGEAESTFVAMPVSADLIRQLRPGDNVIALEVHQVSASSSDLVMDLELTASFHPPVEHILGIGRESGGAPFLYWLDPRWELLSSTNLADWQQVPGATSPWKASPALPAEFYRWRR